MTWNTDSSSWRHSWRTWRILKLPGACEKKCGMVLNVSIPFDRYRFFLRRGENMSRRKNNRHSKENYSLFVIRSGISILDAFHVMKANVYEEMSRHRMLLLRWWHTVGAIMFSSRRVGVRWSNIKKRWVVLAITAYWRMTRVTVTSFVARWINLRFYSWVA